MTTKGVAPPPPKVSKPQQFAQAAEAAGWAVQRERFRKVEDGARVHRIVTATRGDESFRFEWVRNTETGRDNFIAGTHAVGERYSEEWSNIKAAIRHAEAPPADYRVVTDAEGAVELLRLPFNIEEASDQDVLAGLAGQRVVWRNSISGNTEEATCPPLTSEHFRVAAPSGFTGYNEGERIVHLTDKTLVDHKYEVGRFRAFRLSALLGVA